MNIDFITLNLVAGINIGFFLLPSSRFKDGARLADFLVFQFFCFFSASPAVRRGELCGCGGRGGFGGDAAAAAP
ncbi:MAG: hypothetical protein KKD35_07295 [Elusimicrobia bacterium]|nr:hypothetical protein [Elusimicrobiota bacterium]